MIDLNVYTRGDVSNDPLVTSRATRARTGPERRLGLLIHLPHRRVLDREHREPVVARGTRRAVVSRSVAASRPQRLSLVIVIASSRATLLARIARRRATCKNTTHRLPRPPPSSSRAKTSRDDARCEFGHRAFENQISNPSRARRPRHRRRIARDRTRASRRERRRRTSHR